MTDYTGDQGDESEYILPVIVDRDLVENAQQAKERKRIESLNLKLAYE